MGAAGDQHRPHPRRLTLTGYAEFTNHSNYEQDQVNLQYSLFISRTVFAGNRLTQQIHGNLDAPYGAVLMDPPYHAHAFDGALAVIYNPGTKENAGIFSQTQGWLILAEALRGQGQRAYTYFAENAPAAQNDRAEVRHLEPYWLRPVHRRAGQQTFWPLPGALADRHSLHRHGGLRRGHPGAAP